MNIMLTAEMARKRALKNQKEINIDDILKVIEEAVDAGEMDTNYFGHISTMQLQKLRSEPYLYFVTSWQSGLNETAYKISWSEPKQWR